MEVNNNFKKRPEEWYDKNERLNKDHILKVGDRVIAGYTFPWHKLKTPNDSWVVVSINYNEPVTIEDHGFVLIQIEGSAADDTTNTADYNSYHEHYCYYSWKRYLRVIKEELIDDDHNGTSPPPLSE